MDDMSIRLQQLRNNRGITQEQIANELDIQVRTWKSYEYGDRNMPTKVLVNVAKYFNVTSDYLLCLSDEMNPQAKELQQATGLSENAIANISKYRNNNRIMSCINQFISSNEFILAVGNLSVIMTPYNLMENLDSERVAERVVQGYNLHEIGTGKRKRSNAKVTLSGEGLNEWLMMKALQAITKLMERIVKGDTDNGKR